MSTEEVKGTLDIVENDDSAITLLDPKIQRFIHLYMTGQYSLSKLAQLLEVHPNTVAKWLKRQDVKDIIHDMQQQTHDIVATQLKTLTLKATNKLAALIDSPIDGVALQAVKDVLDRGGHKTKQEIKVDKTVRTFEEKLQEVMEKAIDVEYEVLYDEDGGIDEEEEND